MCLIIVKEKGVDPLDSGYFERQWDGNSHGAGVVFLDSTDDTVRFRKGMMVKQDYLDFMQKINKKENAFIAHCRISSRGGVCPENTHPFVLRNVTLAHNGTFTRLATEGNMTDSETFARKFIGDKNLNFVKNNIELFEYATESNKVALMDNNNGEILLLNKSLWQQRDGCYFSHGGAFPITHHSSYPSYGYPTNNYADDDGLFTKDYNPGFANVSFNKQKGYWVRTYTVSGTIEPFGPNIIGKLVRRNRFGEYFLDESASFPMMGDMFDIKKEKVYVQWIKSVISDLYKQKIELINKYLFGFPDSGSEYKIHAYNFLIVGIKKLYKNEFIINEYNLKTYLLGNIDKPTWKEQWGRFYTTLEILIKQFAKEYCTEDTDQPANEEQENFDYVNSKALEEFDDDEPSPNLPLALI